MLYQTFDRFELEDISHLNRVSRHIEHSELTDETLNDRAFYKAERIEDMGTLDKRFLPAMDKALAISIGLNGYSQCPMKQGRLLASLPAHECCPLHDDSVQKKD
ncbi:hypothetical protein [Acutalibacter sp. JLR.KK004]|uniref:hypothetical protein n=1 Tax=Acutalibacter sp. JLR.KK004 TaxID=3112622 RepID=UPI002FF0443A